MDWLRLAKLAWATPCSAVGLLLAAAPIALGARAHLHAGVLEVTWRDHVSACGTLGRTLPFRAITFGHVVLAVTRFELDSMREHERVHVKQYERWGLAFFPAYLLAGAWQWVRGRNPYWDNPFEVQARRECGGGPK